MEFKKYRNKLADDPQAGEALKTYTVSPGDYNRSFVRVEGTLIDITKLDRATTIFYNVTVHKTPLKVSIFGPPWHI